MKIYLSYKQTWIEENELIKDLNFFKSKVEKTWNNLYIFYFEEERNQKADKLNKKFLEEIGKSDLILAYINYPEKSEWQLLELGMAYALNKKIVVLVNEKIEKNYYLSYWLWKTIKFKKLEDLDFDKIL